MEILAAGRELAHHGYTHTSPTDLPKEEGEAELVKGNEILESFGVNVGGYRSPSWDFSAHTLTLLQAHGSRTPRTSWTISVRTGTRGPSIVELPVQSGSSTMLHTSGSTGPLGTKRSRRPPKSEQSGRKSSSESGTSGPLRLHEAPSDHRPPNRRAFLDSIVSFTKGYSDV